MPDCPPCNPYLPGLVGATVGAALAATSQFLWKRYDHPAVEVLEAPSRCYGRFSAATLPTRASSPGAILISLEVKNRSSIASAQNCVPHVAIIPAGGSHAILGGGCWMRPTRGQRKPKALIEDAKTIGPRRKESFVCLVASEGSVFYYDVHGHDDDLSVLWRQVPTTECGFFEAVVFVESPNSRRLLGRHFHVQVVKREEARSAPVDVRFRGGQTSIDFGRISIEEYVRGTAS